MINKRLFSLVSIILILLLFGCSDKKSEGTSSTISDSLNISTAQVTPANNTSTSVEDKKTSTAPNENALEIENKETANEASNESSNKSTITETNKDDTTWKDINDAIQEKNSKKIIVIDPGHGGKSSSEKESNSPDSSVMKAKNVSGATGAWTKTPEHVITLKVATALQEELSSAGYTVIMTRTSASETIGNIARAEIGNKNNADLAIRIHADSSENSTVKGASMLVPGNVGYAKNISTVSKEYGEVIFNTLLSEVGMKSRGIVTRTDLTGFNWSKVPAVLIEMGFLSNHEEDKLLSSEDYQKKIAVGLFKGIEKALGN